MYAEADLRCSWCNRIYTVKVQIADTGREPLGLPPGFCLDPLGGGIDFATGEERPQKILCTECGGACDRVMPEIAAVVNDVREDDDAIDAYYAMIEEAAQRQHARHRLQRDERMRAAERRALAEGH